MSEYIEREKFRKFLIKHFDADFDSDGKLMYSDHICTGEDCEDLLKLVDKIPTADAVEVVRCKDCEFFSPKTDFCRCHDTPIYEDDFCSYGERKEE